MHPSKTQTLISLSEMKLFAEALLMKLDTFSSLVRFAIGKVSRNTGTVLFIAI